MTTRNVRQLVRSVETSDGAGVRLRRSLGQHPELRCDPFLMLDEFGSDDAADYIAGFPPHPHRGFETVTYMLDGHMLHEDHMGNRGDLKNGAVQWMTAGSGIIHSEMPQQSEGRMRGFQLWLNLPSAEKMKPPAYRDIGPDEISEVALPDGGTAKVIAGELVIADGATPGPMRGLSTEPVYLDVTLPAGAPFSHPVNTGHNALIYVFEGNARVGDEDSGTEVPNHAAALLGAGDMVEVRAGNAGARFLLLAGRPLNEPVVQYGPFVMNSREEIEQALRDYRDGRLATAPEKM